MMNYTDAMNYFYGIAPFTKDESLQYALMQSLWFVFASIPIFAVVICLLFLYETKLFKKTYQKDAGFSFEKFLCSGDVLIPLGIGIVVGTVITGINSYHSRYYVDNIISKKEVIESPYFQSLDNQSKQFIKNRLIIGNDGIFKVSTLYSAFVDKQNNVDISKIDVNFFLPNIAIKDLKELINAEIEYRNARNNELEQDKNYKQEMINFIQNAK